LGLIEVCGEFIAASITTKVDEAFFCVCICSSATYVVVVQTV
jgi:hypothetical protein